AVKAYAQNKGRSTGGPTTRAGLSTPMSWAAQSQSRSPAASTYAAHATAPSDRNGHNHFHREANIPQAARPMIARSSEAQSTSGHTISSPTPANCETSHAEMP